MHRPAWRRGNVRAVRHGAAAAPAPHSPSPPASAAAAPAPHARMSLPMSTVCFRIDISSHTRLGIYGHGPSCCLRPASFRRAARSGPRDWPPPRGHAHLTRLTDEVKRTWSRRSASVITRKVASGRPLARQVIISGISSKGFQNVIPSWLRVVGVGVPLRRCALWILARS